MTGAVAAVVRDQAVIAEKTADRILLFPLSLRLRQSRSWMEKSRLLM